MKHVEIIISFWLFTNNGTTQNEELNSKGWPDDPCSTGNAYLFLTQGTKTSTPLLEVWYPK